LAGVAIPRLLGAKFYGAMAGGDGPEAGFQYIEVAGHVAADVADPDDETAVVFEHQGPTGAKLGVPK